MTVSVGTSLPISPPLNPAVRISIATAIPKPFAPDIGAVRPARATSGSSVGPSGAVERPI